MIEDESKDGANWRECVFQIGLTVSRSLDVRSIYRNREGEKIWKFWNRRASRNRIPRDLSINRARADAKTITPDTSGAHHQFPIKSGTGVARRGRSERKAVIEIPPVNPWTKKISIKKGGSGVDRAENNIFHT